MTIPKDDYTCSNNYYIPVEGEVAEQIRAKEPTFEEQWENQTFINEQIEISKGFIAQDLDNIDSDDWEDPTQDKA